MDTPVVRYVKRFLTYAGYRIVPPDSAQNVHAQQAIDELMFQQLKGTDDFAGFKKHVMEGIADHIAHELLKAGRISFTETKQEYPYQQRIIRGTVTVL